MLVREWEEWSGLEEGEAKEKESEWGRGE